MDRASQQNRLRVTMVVDDQYTDAARLATHFRNLQCIFSVRHLGPTEMLARQLALLKVRMDANRRNEILGVVHKHGAQVVDLTPGSLILQFSGTQDQISDLVADLSRIAVIVEMACSGPIALPHYDTRAVGR
jgi:acetolactate synthase-1/3 small subunit